MSMILVACGGGGGGGSDGGGSTPPAPIVVPSDVSISVNPSASSPAQGDFNIGQGATRAELSGLVQGNASSLQGKTIYAIVEDPDGQISGTPVITVDPTGTTFSVVLTLKTDQPEGFKTGNFRVSACLDKACTAQLKGSPLSYPYKFKWTRQLAVNPAQIVATRVYGSEVPVQADFQISSSADATVEAELNIYLDPNHPGLTIPDPRFTVTVPRTASSSTRSGNVQFMPEPPGTYTTTIYLRSSEPSAVKDLTYPQNASATVSYEVKDDPSVAMAFSPARATLTTQAGTTTVSQPITGLARSGDTFVFKSIQYGSSPSAAAGMTLATQWLSTGQPQGTAWGVLTANLLCTGSFPAQCLPAGTYTATVVLEVHRASGAVVDVNYPVSLEVKN